MRLVLQRVTSAAVEVGGLEIGAIGRGLVVLVGVAAGDQEATVARAAQKLAELRIFADADGKMNLDLAAAGGELLLVSQFTLVASLGRGRRPSFDAAARPEFAEAMFDQLVAALRARGTRVATGRFGALMQVRLVNDGPVTFVLDL